MFIAALCTCRSQAQKQGFVASGPNYVYLSAVELRPYHFYSCACVPQYRIPVCKGVCWLAIVADELVLLSVAVYELP